MSARRFRRYVYAAVAIEAVFLVWIGVGPRGHAGVVGNDIVFVVVPLVAALATWIRSRSSAEGRSGWRLLALALLAWGVGETMWGIDEVLLRESPFPGPADVFFLAGTPLVVAGILRLPGPATALARLRAFLDGLVIATSLLFVSWTYVLQLVIVSPAGSALERWLSLAYPFNDILLATMALLWMAHVPGRLRMPFAWLSGGLVLMGVADSLYARLTLAGAYSTGHPIDAVWLAAYLLLGLAALHPMAGRLHGEDDRERPTPLRIMLPYAPVMAGLAVATALQIAGEPLDAFLTWTGMAVLTFIALRQVLAQAENARLIESLDGRVADRTAEAERHRAVAEHQAAELSASQRILMAGVAGTALDATVAGMARGIADQLGYESVAVVLVDVTDASRLHCVATAGLPEDALGRELSAGEGILGRALESKRPQRVEDAQADPGRIAFREDARAQMSVPILVRSDALGVIHVESRLPGEFRDSDLQRLARLAPQAGLIISNAQLLQRERDTVQRLTELDRMRAEFIAITSHELRTPLTAINGFVKTLRGAPERSPELVDTALEVMDRQADRLVALVEELLVASKLEAKTVSIRLEPTRVLDLVRHALEPLGPAATSRVVVDVDPLVPVLQLDPARVGQVLTNLVGNALKFAPLDDVLVRVTRDRDTLVLEVADRGPGIAPEHRKRIFEPFYQVEDYMRRETGGFGLGLHITQTIVEALNGTIAADARPGGGTVFRVRLPLISASLPPGWLARAERADAIRRRLYARRGAAGQETKPALPANAVARKLPVVPRGAWADRQPFSEEAPPAGTATPAGRPAI